jgi:hypothetical protein
MRKYHHNIQAKQALLLYQQQIDILGNEFSVLDGSKEEGLGEELETILAFFSPINFQNF